MENRNEDIFDDPLVRSYIWDSVMVGYIVPSTPLIDATGRNLYEINAKIVNGITCGLSYFEIQKVIICTPSKDISSKIYSIYGGNDTESID